MIKVGLVDDNSFLLKATEDKLDFFEDIQIKLKAIHGQDLLDKLAKNHNIDTILMDIEMPTMNGIEATEMVKSRYPHIKIIILTVFDNDENIFKSINAGADGYLLKEVNPKDLYRGIIDTLNGGATMTPSIALKTLKLFRNPIVFDDALIKTEEINLSNREIEVLEQLSKGLTYNVIAENLYISVGTARKHVENIYTKLHVHNKLEAIKIAKKNNII